MILYILSLYLMTAITGQALAVNVLDENCVVNILNRTVQVNKDGGWSMPNVPSQMGLAFRLTQIETLR